MVKTLQRAAWLLLVISSAVSAQSIRVGDLEIHNAWARVSAPGAPSAGFMLLVNHGTEDETLLSVSGEFAKKLEVHRSLEVDGVMKMQHQREGVVIPAGGEVLFQPGSYHLMFMGLAKNFELGEVYPVILNFEQAGAVPLNLEVRKAALHADH